MTGGAQSLRPEPLTRAAFAAFGDVIEAADAFDVINSGTTQQYRKLTEIEVSTDGGRTQVSLYRVVPYELPLAVRDARTASTVQSALHALERRALSRSGRAAR